MLTLTYEPHPLLFEYSRSQEAKCYQGLVLDCQETKYGLIRASGRCAGGRYENLAELHS